MSERAKATAKKSEPKRDNSVSQTQRTNFSESIGSPVDQILLLQRTVGNQAVQGLLKSGFIQGKLTIGQPGDVYEQEADRVAEQLMQMPDPSIAGKREVYEYDQVPRIQKTCRDCEEELQRQYVPDTGFRYTPPETVKRSIFEIQRIVGTTADGVYGENTRIAVEKYQTELKAVGFYTDILDGKWGDNTEAAHVAFAIAPNLERRRYNCAGFAFKDYEFHSRAATKAIYSTMTKPSGCSDPCEPFQYKFWLWEFRWQGTQPKTNIIMDFHTVGGQTNSEGKGPRLVMSKDGERPVEGPKPPLDWEPKSGPGIDQITGKPIPNTHREVSNIELKCYCSDELP